MLVLLSAEEDVLSKLNARLCYGETEGSETSTKHELGTRMFQDKPWRKGILVDMPGLAGSCLEGTKSAAGTCSGTVQVPRQERVTSLNGKVASTTEALLVKIRLSTSGLRRAMIMLRVWLPSLDHPSGLFQMWKIHHRAALRKAASSLSSKLLGNVMAYATAELTVGQPPNHGCKCTLTAMACPKESHDIKGRPLSWIPKIEEKARRLVR